MYKIVYSWLFKPSYELGKAEQKVMSIAMIVEYSKKSSLARVLNSHRLRALVYRSRQSKTFVKSPT